MPPTAARQEESASIVCINESVYFGKWQARQVSSIKGSRQQTKSLSCQNIFSFWHATALRRRKTVAPRADNFFLSVQTFAALAALPCPASRFVQSSIWIKHGHNPRGLFSTVPSPLSRGQKIIRTVPEASVRQSTISRLMICLPGKGMKSQRGHP